MAVAAEALSERYSPTIDPVLLKRYIEIPQFPTPSRLDELIQRFDTNHAAEGLPVNWYELSRVGFSMKLQMEILESTTPEAKREWAKKSELDLTGFCLEYLTNSLVYPYKYSMTRAADGEIHLVDKKYGTDILETVSENERNGSVVQSLQQIKQFFTAPTTPNGSLAVMLSPLGDTGLRSDDNKLIRYPDSYAFIFEKQGNDIVGFTVKSDFSKIECRNLLKQLTGIVLNPYAPEEEYVRALALITPGSHPRIKQSTDVINLMEDIRSVTKPGSHTIYKDQTFDEVYSSIDRLDTLYNFDQITKNIIHEFTQKITTQQLEKIDIQKALAATVLRLSKQFFDNEKKQKQTWMVMRSGGTPTIIYHINDTMPATGGMGYGDTYNRVQQQAGCQGGGTGESVLDRGLETVTMQSVVARVGIKGVDGENVTPGDCKDIHCPRCGWRPNPDEIKELGKSIVKCPTKGCEYIP